QPAQRIIDRLADVLRRQADLAVAHVHPDLGGQHDSVAFAALLEPAADHAFALAAAVALGPARIDVGGVDQAEAGIDERVEHCERRGFVGGPAEYVAAEGQWRDLQATAAERALLHAMLPAAPDRGREGAW